jgi:hypothetical protein
MINNYIGALILETLEVLERGNDEEGGNYILTHGI